MALIIRSQLGQLGGGFHSQAVFEHASGAGGAIVTDQQGVGGGGQLMLGSLAREHQQDVLCKEVSWLSILVSTKCSEIYKGYNDYIR